MLRSIFRAGRAPIAILATALVTLAVGACADDSLSTAPAAHPNTRAVAAREAAALASDSTLLTFTVDREGRFFSNGYASATATFSCSRILGEIFTVRVTLQQDQKGNALVSSAQYGLTCPPQAQTSVFFVPPIADGRAFKRGKAIATFEIVDGSPLVIRSTTSRAVRLVEAQ